MTEWYMITTPRNRDRESIQLIYLLQFMIDHDVHKWIIGAETGNDGYEHWQIRLYTGMKAFPKDIEEEGEKSLKDYFPKGHIEKASDAMDYERKEGNFYMYSDTPEILQTRYAKLRPWQKEILKDLEHQSDREIDVIIDPDGKSGKSFLVNHLFETGRALYINPMNRNISEVQKDICSAFEKHTYEIIAIDIPRSQKWTNDHYIALEAIKDGIVADPRYGYTCYNIRGVKVIVFCNTAPKLEALTDDRWRIKTLVHAGSTVVVINGRVATK